METEIWRDIEGYEGNYMVSNLGRVKSLNYRRSGKEEILVPGDDGDEYLKVQLYKNGKRHQPYVHRLVACAFIPNPYNLPFINHKDENHKNNRVENLEWILHKDNCRYGTRNERIAKNMTGPKKSKPVLCVETGILYASSREASRQSGASQQNITSCCQGKRKTTGGYHWIYAD